MLAQYTCNHLGMSLKCTLVDIVGALWAFLSGVSDCLWIDGVTIEGPYHRAFSSPCQCMNLPMQTTLYLSTSMSRLLGGLSPTTDHLLISLEFSFFIIYLFIFIPNFCDMDISTMHKPYFMKCSSCMDIYVNMLQQHFQGHDVIVTSSTSSLMKTYYLM